MPTVIPAQTMHFGVMMWDMQGPLASGTSGQIGVGIVSGLVGVLADILTLGFVEIDGLDFDLEIEDYDEGGADYSPHRLRKGGGAKELTFKRGVTGRTDLWDWPRQVLLGSAPAIRKSGIIILFDRNSPASSEEELDTDPVEQRLQRAALNWVRLPIAVWYFHNALPKQIEGPSLNARAEGEAQTAIETLTLAHEGLYRVSLSTIPGMADAAAALGGLLGDAMGGLSAVGQAIGVPT